MIGEPVIEKTTVEKPVEYTTRAWTYEELLDLFSDDFNVIRPLVLRCQQYEKIIDKLADMYMNVETGSYCKFANKEDIYKYLESIK